MPRDRLDRLADRIAEDALRDDAPAQFRLDAFRALSAHKIGMMKAKKGEEPPNPDATTMDSLARRINGVSPDA